MSPKSAELFPAILRRLPSGECDHLRADLALRAARVVFRPDTPVEFSLSVSAPRNDFFSS